MYENPPTIIFFTILGGSLMGNLMLDYWNVLLLNTGFLNCDLVTVSINQIQLQLNVPASSISMFWLSWFQWGIHAL